VGFYITIEPSMVNLVAAGGTEFVVVPIPNGWKHMRAGFACYL